MTRCIRVLFALSCGSHAMLTAQSASTADAEQLLSHLVGRWEMVGTVLGHPVTYTLVTQRVLQGRYVQLHMQDIHRPATYEALVLIGADTAAGQVIAHWLDNTGAAYSIPHATGAARGDTLLLTFPYPTSIFFDTFVYSKASDSWYFRLEKGDSSRGRRLFAEYRVRRVTTKR